MSLHRLDLFSLSLFSLVARSGSISKGAELAHLAVGAASSASPISRAAVGAALLDRNSRGITLTVAGQALQMHAQRILSDVDQLAAGLSDYATGLVGVVRLWANTSAVTQFLPADISSFVRANAGIRIELGQRRSRAGRPRRPGRCRKLCRRGRRGQGVGGHGPRSGSALARALSGLVVTRYGYAVPC